MLLFTFACCLFPLPSPSLLLVSLVLPLISLSFSMQHQQKYLYCVCTFLIGMQSLYACILQCLNYNKASGDSVLKDLLSRPGLVVPRGESQYYSTQCYISVTRRFWFKSPVTPVCVSSSNFVCWIQFLLPFTISFFIIEETSNLSLPNNFYIQYIHYHSNIWCQ